ncbi:MAG TPA: amino acid adenylation domain-containing protein [Pyrinomonadaceae bacterium]|nr:amino acid adenylation domain-containing protein [Pyrinomonadaceae bacterium]
MKVMDSYKEIAELSPAKRELLELLVQEEEPGTDTFPLSFAQQRLWFIDQMEPGNPFYNIVAAMRIKGLLNYAALDKSVTEIVRRHEILRTTFSSVAGQPMQVTHPPFAWSVPIIDLTDVDKDQREAQAQQLAQSEAQQTFDLSRGPLFSMKLLRLDEDDHTLLVTMHHIISDGWSIGVLNREVVTLYQSFAKGVESPLPELEIQYADYAAWQREWFTGDVLDEQLSYWREQLAGAPPVLELPTDHARPAVQTFHGATCDFTLDPSLAKALKALSRQHGATLFMTLLAAFKVLLWRYSGQTSVVVGTPIAGRTQVETEGLIGFFVNTLVLRTEVEAELSFVELLDHVKEVSLGAYAHQEVPFEKLVEELRPERSLSHTPLFQVMFILQNAPNDVLKLAGLEIEPLRVETKTTHFDLLLSMDDRDGQLSGTLEYNTDLFEESSIKRILRHYERLLEAVVANTDRPVSQLPLLSAEEQTQIVYEWNETYREFIPEIAVQELFERQAAERPDQLALVCGTKQLTYGELNARANQLGNYLRELGVGPDVGIGILMERSLEMIISVLGVLKAGGACVPLDIAAPPERLAYMIDDARAPIVLTKQPFLQRLSLNDARCVCLDNDWETIASRSDQNFKVELTNDNLVYVLYTSGTTGKPKGVALPHRALSNLINWQSQIPELARPAKTLQFAFLGFDVAFQEIFSTLRNGGTLFLIDEDTRRDAGKLLRHIQDEAIERIFVPFVVLHHLAEAAELEGIIPDSLTEIVTAGEQLRITPPIIELFRKLNNAVLHNHYGPTETHVMCILALSGEPENWPALVPIGRPISNAQIYVLDNNLQPVPPGVIGEIWIAGESLARGYWFRPQLTAERFVPHPFGTAPGERLYRTGDIGRLHEDGKVQYLGRGDQQVKVRGHRVELEEIETVLGQHEGVEQAVVVLSEVDRAGKRLVAYVVPDKDLELQVGDLRRHLREQLPEYMVPSAFVLLDRLPLTKNGKVDRRMLPAPEPLRSDLEATYVAPRTAVEELLVEIWESVLGVERVGAHDNFFDLGGHSLLATRVISRVRQAFAIDLPLRKLFEEPTVAGLATIVDEVLVGEERITAPPLRAAARDGDLPLSFAQQRLWFINQMDPGSSTYHISSAVKLSGPLDVVALKRAFDDVVRRHEVLRTSFPTVDNQPVQRIAAPKDFDLPVIDLLTDASLENRRKEAHRIAAEEARRPFDLATGSLLRATLIRVAEQEHVVSLTMHHIVSDGWSISVLIREVASLYRAFAAGKDSPLPELAIQYADYALWQREWLSGEVLERQLKYWRRQLAGAPPVLELPTDRPRPPVQTFHGAAESFNLDHALTEQLKSLSRTEGTTLFMTLLAAFKTLLFRYSEQASIVVGTPIAGRTQVETEGLIGLFINTLVLRTEVEATLSFRELLGKVKEVALAAYAHQDVPFEKLVEEIEPKRSLSHSPLFQVLMSLQNTSMETPEMAELQLTALPEQNVTAKFDLTLSMSETDEKLSGSIEYNTDLFDAATIKRMSRHFQQLLRSITEHPEQRVGELQMLTAPEEQQLLVEWNDTQADHLRSHLIHRLFEAQVEQTPAAIAVVYEAEQLTYRELNNRASQLAHYLRESGVGADSLVAVMMDRSTEMLVALLAVLKAGGAYVPVDPQYPQERVRYMLKDCGASVLLTRSGSVAEVARVIDLDREWDQIAERSKENVRDEISEDNLAYVMYTSGSTGQPKGVMVTHGDVTNFFVGMDQRLRHDPPGTWLALTSISFDISVLELFWTITRGFKVVIQSSQVESFYAAKSPQNIAEKQIDFSLFYFASDDNADGGDKYRFLMEGAKFADRHDFTAVWTPERHFHAFGGLYPNPSVAGAAIAAITEKVGIRAGSVVMPLHNPIRVAEEWSVVDNISGGRVAISFASGWHVNDFVFAPENYTDRKQIMLNGIETVRKLWRGEKVGFRSGAENTIDLQIFPRPIQKELPIWLTAAGNPETFEIAGEIGANVLTHLLGQSLEDVSAKIAIYRQAWRKHGHKGSGHVTLMLHTFVSDDLDYVREKVREPFTNYLKSSVDLIRNMAVSLGKDVDQKKWTEADFKAVLDHAFDRYFATSGLFGTPAMCLDRINQLKMLGVDEVACLIDFGVDFDSVMFGLEHLNKVRVAGNAKNEHHYNLPAQIETHQVTHLQCTPSMGRMLLLEPETEAALGTVKEVLIGGEALPVSLAKQLRDVAPESLLNMYGPTETTIWSTTYDVDDVGAGMSIGKPIANTEVFIVDKQLRPVPVGVTGELLIGGDGLARGYFRRPAVTAEKFVPNPFSKREGSRLYRTGDRVRYRADGNIEFLGRVDQQVKVGGHRVELEEIESALVQHEWVNEAVVTARDDENGRKRLVAYLVVNRAQQTLEQQLSDRDSSAATQRRFTLPNGMVVAQLSDFQSNLAYREIFEREVYLKHGITLNDGDCVFDVGANRGTFTLYANHKAKNVKVYAFEPIPTTFEVLRTNVGLHSVDAKLFNCGVSDKAGSADFTFYPLMDGLSSRYADIEKDKEVTRTIILDWIKEHPDENGQRLLTADELEQVLEDRFRTETFACPLRTLSDVIAEENIEQIDYLKVDCERSELDVLQGIREDDWKKIKQVVLEVETDDMLEEIIALLTERGFEVNVDRVINVDAKADVEAVHVYMLYAVQRDFQPAVKRTAPSEATFTPMPSVYQSEWSINGVRNFVQEKLPSFMIPSAFVLLDSLPMTPNGKVDRENLPDPDGLRPESEVAYVEPETDTELLISGVWKEVLGLERVGVNDNFFEVGGTSLLIAQVYSRLRDHYHDRITMVDLFRQPTIGSLAKFLSGRSEGSEQVIRQTQERITSKARAVSEQQKLMAERRRQAGANKKLKKSFPLDQPVAALVTE